MGFGTKLALDVVGGALTDPLTFLDFGARGLAAKGLLGATRPVKAERAVQAIKHMPRGEAVLSDTILAPMRRALDKLKDIPEGSLTPEQKIRVQNNPVINRMRDIVEGQVALNAEAFKGVLGNPGPAFRRLEATAAEELFFKHSQANNLPGAIKAQRFSQHLRHSELSDGIKGLVAENLARPNESLWRLPFTNITAPLLPGTRLGENFWSKVGQYGTAPGWVRYAFKHSPNPTGRAIAEAVDGAVVESTDWLYAKLWDKTSKFSHLLPESFHNVVRKLNSEEIGKGTAKQIDVDRFGRDLSPEDSRHIFTAYKKAEDEFYKTAQGLTSAPAPKTPQAQVTTPVKPKPTVAPGATTDPFPLEPLNRPAVKILPWPEQPKPTGVSAPKTAIIPKPASKPRQPGLEVELDLDKIKKQLRERLLQERQLKKAIEREAATRLTARVSKPKPTGVSAPKTAIIPKPAAIEVPDTLTSMKNRIVLEASQAIGPMSLEKAATVRAFVNTVFDDFNSVPKELVNAGVWEDSLTANPFYIPQQLGGVFSVLQDAGIMKPEIRQDLLALFKRPGLKDVFTGTREHKLQEKFLANAEEILGKIALKEGDDVVEAALAQLAAKHKVDVEGLVGASKLQETDMVKLWRDRMFAHYRTMTRSGMAKEAKRFQDILPGGQNLEGTFQKYIKYQLDPLQQRRGWLERILGGGEFSVPVTAGAEGALNKWAVKDGLITRRVEDGRAIFNWPGLNYFWKPLLTSAAIPLPKGKSFPLNPAYFNRNILGAFTMASHSPELAQGPKGLAGNLRALTDAVQDVFLVKTLGHKSWAPQHISDFITAIDGPAVEVEQAVARLKDSGMVFGSHTAGEVIDQVRELLGPRFAPNGDRLHLGSADIATGFYNLDKYGREVVTNGPWAKKAFHRIVQQGVDVSEWSERRFRLQGYLSALDAGVSPANAKQMVNDAYVDYSMNSEVERWLRDYIPFAKWSLGASKWAKTIANRPALVNWMGHVRGTEEGDFLPERAKESLALPMPWLDLEGNRQFLIGLGLPLETTINLLSLPTPEGARRLVLGGLQPAVQLPLKAITNRNFYFGDEFGDFRAAPAWAKAIPGLTVEVPVGNGRVRHEINGTFNEIIGSTPTSRLEGMFNKWFDDRRSVWNKALNTLTGVRTVSVDTEQEFRLRMMEYLKDKARSGQVGETLVYFDRFGTDDMPEDLKIVLQSLKTLKAEARKRRASLLTPAQ
jgi:hypothetical protein